MKKFNATDLIAKVCHILEYVVAAMVSIGILIAILFLIPDMKELLLSKSVSRFFEFLENAFIVVIGIEFLMMLCKPNSDNVLDAIIFLMARHMIVNPKYTPLESFTSAATIALLCFVRRYLNMTRAKDKRIALEEELRIRDLEKKTKIKTETKESYDDF